MQDLENNNWIVLDSLRKISESKFLVKASFIVFTIFVDMKTPGKKTLLIVLVLRVLK